MTGKCVYGSMVVAMKAMEWLRNAGIASRPLRFVVHNDGVGGVVHANSKMKNIT
jgi:hypothetical protein